MKERSILLWLAVLLLLLCLPAGAATSVDAVIEQTWSSIRGQIQNVVNNVVFPAVDMILAVVFFVKLPICSRPRATWSRSWIRSSRR